MLKTEHLRCFVSTVDAGSLAAAAVRLHLSPSAVGYAIDALEQQLDTTLLIRRRAAGVSITADGSRLLRIARPLLQELHDVDNMFASRGGTLTGQLAIGCQEALSWSLAPLVIEAMKARHPLIEIDLKTIFMDDGHDPLLNAQVDVLITFLADVVENAAIDQDILCRPRPYAMMRRGHPLDRNGEPIPLAELATYPQLFIQDGPAFELFTGLYRHQGLQPQSAMVANISTAAQAIVGTSDCVSLRIVRPAHGWSPLGDQLAYAVVADHHITPLLAVCTVRPRHGRKSRKVAEFISIAKKFVDDGTLQKFLFY